MMDSRLNKILNDILLHWLKDNIIVNFSLLELFVMISKLCNNTIKFEEVMELMEIKYSLPTSLSGDWINCSKSNLFICNVYRSLLEFKNERNESNGLYINKIRAKH